MAGLKDRRAALRDMTGAGLALVSLARADLGLAAEDDVLVEGCRLSGEKCDKNHQCCSGDCKGSKKKKKKDKNGKKRRRKQGECKCRGEGSSCSKDAACCRGYCNKNDGRCRCVPNNSTCNKDSDCCKGSCKKDKNGNYFCKKK